MKTAAKLTPNHVVQRVADQIAAEVDDDLVMVNVETGYYYAVSDVARDIWDSIERPTKISNLIDELAKMKGKFSCIKYSRHYCEECMKCSDPRLYCKFRSMCIIWEYAKHGDMDNKP